MIDIPHKDEWIAACKELLDCYETGRASSVCPLCTLGFKLMGGQGSVKNRCSICVWKVLEGEFCAMWAEKQGYVSSVDYMRLILHKTWVKRRIKMLKRWIIELEKGR